MSRAEAALRANDQETAAREFRVVLTQDPNNIEAHANLGVIEFFRGDCQGASKDLGRAVAARPSLVRAQALLGICQKKLGAPSAQKTLEQSFVKLTEPKLRTQVGLELAELYQRTGDAEHTASLLGALVELNPESPDILYFAQHTYSELAQDTLNKLAIVAPGSGRMQQVIAERLVNAGDLKAAIEHYRKALEVDPRLPGVRYELSEAILESAPADSAAQTQAEQELQKAQQEEGDSSRIESELGRIAELRADADQAAAHYRRALELNPNNLSAQMGMGRILMGKQQPELALSYLRQAVQTDPLNTEAHYRLALVYRSLQQTEGAQKEMKLYQDIKRAKEQVKALYKQMNAEPRQETNSGMDLAK